MCWASSPPRSSTRRVPCSLPMSGPPSGLPASDEEHLARLTGERRVGERLPGLLHDEPRIAHDFGEPRRVVESYPVRTPFGASAPLPGRVDREEPRERVELAVLRDDHPARGRPPVGLEELRH